MSEPRTLLLTRPEDQSRAFAAALDAALPGRFAPLIAPMTRIAAVDAPLDLAGVAGLMFTSANGVAQFAARGIATGLPAYCVGAMTAAAARAAGLRAQSADGDVAALAMLAAAAWRPGQGRCSISGAPRAGDLVGRLAALGVPARAAEIYAQEPCPLPEPARAAFAERRIDIITLFSPRSATALRAALAAGGWSLRTVRAAALSPAADAGLGPLPLLAREIASAPTRAGMIELLARF